MVFRDLNKDNPNTYEGDLEADYLRFLAKVQKAAKENPMDVKFDFTEGYAKILESRSPNNMYSDSRTEHGQRVSK